MAREKWLIAEPSQVTLADRQADQDSPLYSAQTFDQLNLWGGKVT